MNTHTLEKSCHFQRLFHESHPHPKRSTQSISNCDKVYQPSSISREDATPVHCGESLSHISDRFNAISYLYAQEDRHEIVRQIKGKTTDKSNFDLSRRENINLNTLFFSCLNKHRLSMGSPKWCQLGGKLHVRG